MVRINALSVASTIIWATFFLWLSCLLIAKQKKHQASLAFLALSLIRFFVPVSPRYGVIIPDSYVLPTVLEWMRTPVLGSFTGKELLLCVWFAAALGRGVVLAVRLAGQKRFWEDAPQPSPESWLWSAADDTARELGLAGKVGLAFSHGHQSAYQMGFFRPRVLLPHDAEQLSPETMRHILRHELSHFIGGDLWIKLGVQALCCVLWWNPVMPLFRRSVDQLLELRCDRRACCDFTEVERLAYAETLFNALSGSAGEGRKLSAGYTGDNADARIIQRFQMVLDGDPGPCPKGKLLTALALCLTLFTISYFVELQPECDPPPEDMEGVIEVTRDNSYLVRMGDGAFELYYEGEYLDTICKEDLHYRPYCYLKIQNKEVLK